ncbi:MULTISPECIES: sulfite exporter TauE/SafE family protein [Pseudomonas]|uniref:Probable membrane transporter protein n=2 Tax=Pseudomonadaceae TaxID=135621 RepID=A0A0D0IYD6_9PSED|nr:MULTISPECIES: sulfite exporter TauE/SafE family protein [Pseudomonas]KIP88058.1 membrane protein [Pseudomonas fulva]MCW2293094.1 putative membrane protein YfcA [Pseudomonas sp. BIGb0408]NYH72336.1 hypothetical protein [Pseudomonas flavescens]
MNESLSLLLPLMLIFLVAGVVKGVTGMGLPTVAMGLLVTFMSPAAAAALLVIPSLVSNLWQSLAGPATVSLLRRLWPMALGILLGTLSSTALLVRVDPSWSAFGLGCALLAYASYALVSPAVSVPARWERTLSPLVGIVTGLITGGTGVFVMPAVPYLQALRLSKDELVQALGLSFTVSTLALAGGLLLQGAFRVDQLGVSSLAVIPALLGMWLGQSIRARLSPRHFRLCFLWFLLILGLELISRPFF